MPSVHQQKALRLPSLVETGWIGGRSSGECVPFTGKYSCRFLSGRERSVRRRDAMLVCEARMQAPTTPPSIRSNPSWPHGFILCDPNLLQHRRAGCFWMHASRTSKPKHEYQARLFQRSLQTSITRVSLQISHHVLILLAYSPRINLHGLLQIRRLFVLLRTLLLLQMLDVLLGDT